MSETKTVLIVDDEPDAVAFAEAVISDIEGCTTLTASDGISGLASAKEAKPDLILLDVQMPGMGGFEVFGELKKDPDMSNIPVVMSTGVAERTGLHFSSGAMGEFFGKEPEAYIEKPVEPEQLDQTIRRLLGL